ncbi:enoyl-CoA hydratase-related protein [Jatrophihabitans sp.]|jgi:polyketide biosynthesis enoyl-CoA hydratase PksH|uniref:enoyl-CoA hydratase-related protein n=1 Tax=Jatrophihabitans sp. TaxID=1932789 RepID=UPI002EDC0C9E
MAATGNGAVVRVQDAGPGVLRVLLDRPEAGNGITATMLAQLHGALDRAESEPDSRIVVLESTAAVFCSGMDLSEAVEASSGGDPADGGKEFLGLLRRLTRIPRLVVSRVEGPALGGGVGLVAASDLVLAGPAATFALPEALWGLLPACVMPFLMRRIGFQAAHRMALTTLPMDADEAARVQLADQVLTDATPVIRQLSRRMRRIDPITVGDAKRYSAEVWGGGAAQDQLAIAEFSRLMTSDLSHRRIAAFLDGAAIGAG